jgi:hypothetical protein
MDSNIYSINTNNYFTNQQSGDAKKPYLAQYSAVLEDSPVIKSCIVIKTNIVIKRNLIHQTHTLKSF